MSKVAVVKTQDQSYESIKKAVDQVIEQIGGLEDIIKPGYKVIIKPNLVALPHGPSLRRHHSVGSLPCNL